MTAREFAKDLIEGPGGFDSWVEHEYPAFEDTEKIEVVLWTLRCLANPECRGSKEAVAAILERRAKAKGGA